MYGVSDEAARVYRALSAHRSESDGTQEGVVSLVCIVMSWWRSQGQAVVLYLITAVASGRVDLGECEQGRETGVPPSVGSPHDLSPHLGLGRSSVYRLLA